MKSTVVLSLSVVLLVSCERGNVAVHPSVTEPARAAAAPTPRAFQAARFDYPAARRTDAADVLHSTTVPDPYRWLEPENDEVERWFEAQDERARREILKLGHAGELVERMKALYKQPLSPLPTRRGKLAFSRQGGTIHVRDEGGADRLVFDEGTLASGVRMTNFVPSREGDFIAVELSKNGADMRSVKVVETRTGRVLEELGGSEGTKIVWARGGFFYAFTPSDVPHAARWASRDIRFHQTGKPQSEDRVVVPASRDKDASSGMNALAVTKDGARLVARTFDTWARTTYAVVDLTKPSWPVTELTAPKGSVKGVVVVEDAIYALVRHDDGTAEIGRVKKGTTAFEPLAPATSQLLGLEAFGATIVVSYAASPGEAAGGFVRRELYDASFRKLAEASTPRGSTDIYFGYPDSSKLIVTREGLGIPQYRFELDSKTGATSVFAPSKVEWDAEAFVTDSLETTSKDGTKVPITVLRRKDTPVDGSGALAVYGYGGFQNSVEQVFYPPWMTWAAGKGRVFASCHTRGGLEHGVAWHEGGARRNRQNTIDDFHACIEELHQRGYGSPARTLTQGWSHGGMLVAAAALERPELQRVVLCQVPLIDMVRFPLFGRGGVDEYGDPDRPEDFAVLSAVSPYHRVRDGVRYPAFFVTAASKDERAHPMHARKLVAALQHASTGGEVLLKVLWDAGHGGGGKDDPNQVIVEGMAFALARFEQPLEHD